MLRTLGTLSLEGPQARGFRKKKPLLLLAYLALEGPRSRHHLAELFWPEASDPMNSLSVALTQLRTVGVPVVGGEVVRSEVPCDALHLRALLAEGRLEEGRSLYRGRFLEGADDGLPAELEEWVWHQREALAEALWRAHARRAGALYALGLAEDADALLREVERLPGAGEPPEDMAPSEPLDHEAQRAYFAIQLVGLTRAVELMGLRAEALERLMARGLLDAQGQPTLEAPMTLEGRKAALELARRLPLKEAAPLYQAARGCWEASDVARGQRALLSIARGQVEEAPHQALALLAELAPEPEILFLRARALERLGRYRETLELLEELPQSPERSALRGSVLLRLGHVTEALAEAEIASQGGLYPQAEALNLQGMALLAQGRFREAAEAFSRAAVRFLMAGEEVRHLGALGNRAVALAELGEGEGAFAEVLEAVGDRAWLRARIYLNLGVLKERQGKTAEAERLYRESLALAQGNLEAMGRAWNNLGALYHRQGRAEEARAAYHEALRLAQASQEWVLTAAVLANLAELTGERANLEEAIALLEEARYTELAERYRNRLSSFSGQ